MFVCDMKAQQPPSAASVPGWTFASHRVGHRAVVSVINESSMRVDFALNETGPDSGMVAIDRTVAALKYQVYFPGAGAEACPSSVALPGLGAVQPTAAAVFRTPGWNTVEITVEGTVRINATEFPEGLTMGRSYDLGCYALRAQTPGSYVVMQAFEVVRSRALPLDLSKSTHPAARLRFA